MTKIINEYPPNIVAIEEHFDLTGRTVYFTYGDAIYNPSGTHIAPDYVFHEEVHMKQQRDIGGPEIWWDKYIKDPAFRIEQEVDAYGQQLRYIRRNNAKKVARELNHFAEVLSSALYGNMMTEEDARRQVWDRSMRP